MIVQIQNNSGAQSKDFQADLNIAPIQNNLYAESMMVQAEELAFFLPHQFVPSFYFLRLNFLLSMRL